LDIDRFSKSPIGTLVPISGADGLGRDFEHFAYVPNPLPSKIDLSAETWNVIADAQMELGRLDGEGHRMLNPSVLARPSIRSEAISSSALEGTYTTLPQVLQSEVFEDESSSDVAEVMSYVRAAEVGFQLVADGQPLSVNMLKRLHGILMATDRRCPANEKGEIRSRQNFIGPRPDSLITESHFVPPPPDERLRKGVYEWEQWIHRQDINRLVRMAAGHYQFEALHPFFDGNGRIGRLAAILLLLHEGALSVPLLNVSPYLDAHREAYQNHLRDLSVTGDFDPWVHFFCEGVRVQSDEALAKIDHLLSIKQAMLDDLHRRKVRGVALRVAEDLVGFPYMTPNLASRRYNVTWQAGTNALNALERMGHVEKIPWTGNRLLFASQAIIDVLYRS
jgi:cell filamentation protein, protein adenylyltransferase